MSIYSETVKLQYTFKHITKLVDIPRQRSVTEQSSRRVGGGVVVPFIVLDGYVTLAPPNPYHLPDQHLVEV